MSIYRIGEKLEANMDGIWLDFRDNTFLFMIKDRLWSKGERKAAKKNDVVIQFVQKGILDLFLVSIEDCFECSDIPFCMKEADEVLIHSLDGNEDYGFAVVLLEEDGTVDYVREGMFSHVDSLTLKAKLKERLEQDYNTEDFDHAYEKNSMRYEPYELETFALFKEVIRK